MKRVHLDEIKSLESPPRTVNIFLEKEIKMTSFILQFLDL